jgi:hypothetical protein
MGPLAAEPTAPDVSDTQTYPRVRRHCPTDIGHPSGELNARSGMCWTVRSSENAFVEPQETGLLLNCGHDFGVLTNENERQAGDHERREE